MANLPEIIGALAADALSAFSIPGGSIAGVAVAAYGKRVSDRARDILFEELSNGGKSPEQVAAQDDGIAVIHGYMRAAWEGRARVNMRLLAKAITGQLRAGNLVADEFFLYADALAGLTRDEIILLATMHRKYIEMPAPAKPSAADENKLPPYWNACVDELVGTGIWSKDKVEETAASCLRSGFVMSHQHGAV